jgi:hypothetical protein
MKFWFALASSNNFKLSKVLSMVKIWLGNVSGCLP